MRWKEFKAKKFDVIMNFAASLVLPESAANSLKYYLKNTANTTNLVNLVNRYGVKNFIFSSNTAVYGESRLIENLSNSIKVNRKRSK